MNSNFSAAARLSITAKEKAGDDVAGLAHRIA
jgi:hypothetical protein